MRHLRKFNEDSKFENDQEISDLRESLLEVSDKLGEPTINNILCLRPDEEKTYIYTV